MTIQWSLLALAAILYVAGAFRLTRAAVGRCPRSRGYLLLRLEPRGAAQSSPD